MDTIPIELYEIIFGFLSVKEKITIREVSLLFIIIWYMLVYFVLFLYTI